MIRKYLLNLVKLNETGTPIYMLSYDHLDAAEFIVAQHLYLSEEFANKLVYKKFSTYLTYGRGNKYGNYTNWQIGFYANIIMYNEAVGLCEWDSENYNEDLRSLGAACRELSQFIED